MISYTTFSVSNNGEKTMDEFKGVINSAADIRIYDYITSEKLLRWMIGKYIDRADGKRRVFKRSSKALIYLHEPLSPIDLTDHIF